MHHDSIVTTGARAAYGALILALVALVGFIVVVGERPMSERAQDAAYFLPSGAALASTLLLGIALVGSHQWQRERLGTLGRVGFVGALVGTMLAAGAQWSYVFVVPYFADAAPKLVDVGSGILLAGFISSYAALALGWILYGLGTLRAGSVPRWLGSLIVAGAAIAFLPMPSRTLILAIGVALLARRMEAAPVDQT